MSDLEMSFHTAGFNNIIRKMADRSTTKIEPGDWVRIGPLRLKFDGAKGHAEVGNSTFRIIDPAVGGARGQIKELDWKWDRLSLLVGLDLPTITLGGWCLIPKPFGGCAVRAPKLTVFSRDPDIEVPISLAGLRHEISSAFNIEAKSNSAEKKYELFLKPEMPLDVDIIDISDIAGDLLDRLVSLIVDELFRPLPQWVRSAINAILGGISKLVRKILNLADSLSEWISEMVGVSLGLFNLLASIVIELFYKAEPIFAIDNPYQIFPEQNNEPEVTIDISNVSATFSYDEQCLKIGLVV